MQLASRLRQTTLGDLLASLHRGGASGVLELIEPHDRHAIHLRRGFVHAVESDASASRLGEMAVRMRSVARPMIERARFQARLQGMRIGQAMVAARLLSPTDVDALLAAQQRERLDRLYAVSDAEVRFRVSRPLPEGASEQSPLSPREVFYGRPRTRGNTRSWPRSYPVAPRQEPLVVLGLNPGASIGEIRAAYRRLVFELHPDRASSWWWCGTEQQRAESVRRLVAVVEAYHKLSCG